MTFDICEMHLMFYMRIQNHPAKSHLQICDVKSKQIKSKTTMHVVSDMKICIQQSYQWEFWFHFSFSFCWETVNIFRSTVVSNETNGTLILKVSFFPSIRSNDMQCNEKWDSFVFYETISRKVWRWWWQPRFDGKKCKMRNERRKTNLHLEIMCQTS